jgi:hypothetical protein
MAQRGGPVAVSAASRETGVPARTLYHWIAGGRLRAIAGNRGKLVAPADVRALAAESAIAGNGAPESASPDDDGAQPSATARNGAHTAGNGAQSSAMAAEGEAARELVALVERLHRENVELAGRLGFYQARVQELEGRVKLLTESAPAPAETPAEASPAPPQRPWWRFWRRQGANNAA